MTASRDAILDAILTATPQKAWQVIFEKLWEIFSAPVTAQHAEREVTERERKIGELELILSGSAWELWRDFETSVPHTAPSLIEFWNKIPSGKAVLILDALSLRESAWLLQEAERRGYQLHQSGARGSEIPSDTTSFAKALGFAQRSSFENNGAGYAHHLPGARTESMNAAWDYCLDWIASARKLRFGITGRTSVSTNWPSPAMVFRSYAAKPRNSLPQIRFGRWLNAWPLDAAW